MSCNYPDAEYWNEVARRWPPKGYSEELLLEYKRKTHLDLVARWAEVTGSQRILKTDIFEEAFGADQFMFDLARANGNVMGMDISNEIAARAKRRSKQYGADFGEYICCDVRWLPFANDSIDLIISDSTLDHFHVASDIITALQELRRVLKPGATLILTMDNKGNLTEPFFRLWILLGLAPFFIGKTYSIKRLKQVLGELGFRVEASTAIVHYPRLFTRITVSFLRRLNARKFDLMIWKALALLDRLEKTKIRYLTALYIAAKATKRETP